MSIKFCYSLSDRFCGKSKNWFWYSSLPSRGSTNASINFYLAW